ncbi:hypothetical protein [Tenacibaculum singaporense]|nr:hypothetical protein [Tenacibaculum singaporense]
MRIIRLRNREIATSHVIIPAESPKKEMDKNNPISKKINPVVLVKKLLD